MAITDEAELRALYGEMHPRAKKKIIDRLDQHCLAFIAASPFVLIATSDGSRLDVSPRGDPAGSVIVEDDRHLLIADRPGNNRIDGLVNILKHPRVGTIFLIPGVRETLRVNGTATIHAEPALLERCRMNGRAADHHPAAGGRGGLPALRQGAAALAAVGAGKLAARPAGADHERHDPRPHQGRPATRTGRGDGRPVRHDIVLGALLVAVRRRRRRRGQRADPARPARRPARGRRRPATRRAARPSARPSGQVTPGCDSAHATARVGSRGRPRALAPAPGAAVQYAGSA